MTLREQIKQDLDATKEKVYASAAARYGQVPEHFRKLVDTISEALLSNLDQVPDTWFRTANVTDAKSYVAAWRVFVPAAKNYGTEYHKAAVLLWQNL